MTCINMMAPKEFYEDMINKVRIGKQFSMVRLGDGELLVIKYPKYTPRDEVIHQFKKWFPVDNITEDDIIKIGNEIMTACRKADLLGGPSEYEYTRWPKWNRDLRWHTFLKEYGFLEDPSRKLFHFYLLGEWWTSGYFDKMMVYAKNVVLISCRDVVDRMKRRYKHLDTIEWWEIPPEDFVWRRYSQILDAQGSYSGERHYPTLFNKYMKKIRESNGKYAGYLFIIGAGGLGKIYCHAAKYAGAMAVDVGALFDGWVGIPTRPYLANAGRYEM